MLSYNRIEWRPGSVIWFIHGFFSFNVEGQIKQMRRDPLLKYKFISLRISVMVEKNTNMEYMLILNF